MAGPRLRATVACSHTRPLSCTDVLVAYDRDDAGDRAAATLTTKLLAAGIAVSRIEFPKGMDANEYALKVQPASRSLSVLVRAATWLGW
jgi:DNA primase